VRIVGDGLKVTYPNTFVFTVAGVDVAIYEFCSAS